MNILNYMKRTANKNTIWVNTAGTGAALADHLEAQGVPVNRFSINDQSFLRQHLGCVQHENLQSSSTDELLQ